MAATKATAAQRTFPGPGASTHAKKLAYSGYCAKGKRHNARKAKERRMCFNAMARLAAGKAKSPKAACRTLKPKRSRGHKVSKSAYKRCVKAGKRLQKNQRATTGPGGANGAATAHDDAATANQDAAEEAAEAAAEAAEEAAEGLEAQTIIQGGGSEPTMPDPDDDPVEEPDDESDEDADWDA